VRYHSYEQTLHLLAPLANNTPA